MSLVNRKDTLDKRNSLGQFFTPKQTALFCFQHTEITTNLVIEPSCGKGVFLDLIKDKNIIALEVDAKITNRQDVKIMNFYDFNEKISEDVTFIGNPPFHSPAVSLTDNKLYNRKSVVRKLTKKYGISGIREEAVFFIIKSVDLILTNKVKGHIYYILPKTIFHNNSKSYKTFFSFLKKYVRLEKVIDLPKDFEGVNTDLCWVHFSVGYSDDKDNKFYGVNEDVITFHNIFKKTYLGSVPCESILLSVRGEPLEHFRDRLYRLMTTEIKTDDQLLELLSYNGEVHLLSLKRRDARKIEIVRENIKDIVVMVPVEDFLGDHYKPIRHRHEDRWYFRHNALKKAKNFIYQLNPNPCPSFYFPSNIAKNCLDYHGYCDYDVNRNCSPSANRTVPIDGIEENLTDEFKEYWDRNTGLSYNYVFGYLSFILESDWYKGMKKHYQRWYFGIPSMFDNNYLERDIYASLLARNRYNKVD